MRLHGHCFLDMTQITPMNPKKFKFKDNFENIFTNKPAMIFGLFAPHMKGKIWQEKFRNLADLHFPNKCKTLCLGVPHYVVS